MRRRLDLVMVLATDAETVIFPPSTSVSSTVNPSANSIGGSDIMKEVASSMLSCTPSPQSNVTSVSSPVIVIEGTL